jgi:hypothetical protein
MLAQERFPGQRLTIEGCPKFKKQLVEIVAKQSLNVSFTDKEMEQTLHQVLFRKRKIEKMLEI